MTAPIIGITTGRGISASGLALISLTEAYVIAVLRAGGVPALIPVGMPADRLDALYPHLDGLLLTGGGDIDPARFNGAPHPRVGEVDPQRDELEISLAQRAAQDGLPFLGICRGIQVINVALGGTLFTDIADQHPAAPKHDFYPNFPRNHLAHSVRIVPETRLFNLVGAPEAQVNSLHHQGIQKLAPALQPIAYAPDGLVEAVELPAHPYGVGVQWHPEWLPDRADMQALFAGLVAAAGQ